MAEDSQRKEVFVITKSGNKSFWHRCGVGFVNRDNSINMKLDLFPGVDFQIRDAHPKEEDERR